MPCGGGLANAEARQCPERPGALLEKGPVRRLKVHRDRQAEADERKSVPSCWASRALSPHPSMSMQRDSLAGGCRLTPYAEREGSHLEICRRWTVELGRSHKDARNSIRWSDLGRKVPPIAGPFVSSVAGGGLGEEKPSL